jgi:hypothetical protein
MHGDVISESDLTSLTTHVAGTACPPSTMGRDARLVDIVKLEEQARLSGTLEDVVQVWAINLYGQRVFWYYIFVGLIDAFKILFCQFILEIFPAPSYNGEYFKLRAYLRYFTGILLPAHADAILLPSMKKRKSCSILHKPRHRISNLNAFGHSM